MMAPLDSNAKHIKSKFRQINIFYEDWIYAQAHRQAALSVKHTLTVVDRFTRFSEDFCREICNEI